jgi:hypothetical protein
MPEWSVLQIPEKPRKSALYFAVSWKSRGHRYRKEDLRHDYRKRSPQTDFPYCRMQLRESDRHAQRGAPERPCVQLLGMPERLGSAFTYTSFFPESAVAAIEGEHRSWRRTAASGRWIESSFCSRCGNTVFRRWEALPGIFGVPVGCFADPTFAAPAKLYFSSQRHRWLTLPAGVELIAMQ